MLSTTFPLIEKLFGLSSLLLFAKTVVKLNNAITKANVLIFHGICEHSLRYTYLIDFLNKQGISCAAIDHLGHGQQVSSSENFQEQSKLYRQSPTSKSLLESFHSCRKENRESFQSSFYKANHALDLNEIVQFQKEYIHFLYQENIFSKDKPLFLLGQSMGGLIAAELSYVIKDDNLPFKGSILLSPAFKPIATHLPGFLNGLRYTVEQTFLNKCWQACQGKSPLFSKTIFRAALAANPPVDSGKVGDFICDIVENNELFKNDPLIGRNITLRFLHSILVLMTQVHDKAAEFPRPFLLLYGEDDKIVHSQGSKDFFQINNQSKNKFPESSSTCYEGFFPHELHNSSKQSEIMQEIATWITTLAASD